MVGDHGEVGREDGEEQGDKAPGGCRLGHGDEEADTAEDLGNAADLNEERGMRQVSGDDAHVGRGEEEMQRACDDVERGHDKAGGLGHKAGYQDRIKQKMAAGLSLPPYRRCVLITWTRVRCDGHAHNCES